MGEALSQAQHVAAEREALTALLIGGAGGHGGMDMTAIGDLLTRLTDEHSRRMQALGLSS